MAAPTARGVSHDFLTEHIAHELKWVRRGRKKFVSLRELERRLTRTLHVSRSQRRKHG
jgi:hypothetical protein